MSAYVTFLTPMLDTATLVGALGDIGIASTDLRVEGDSVVVGGHRSMRFDRTPTGFLARSERLDREWLGRVHASYVRLEERREREDRRAVEEARARAVESQRAHIYAKARALGYTVTESRESGTLRMVLVRRSY